MIEVSTSEHWRLNVTRDEAHLYCFMLEIDGKRGWRVPTEQEADDMVTMIYDDNSCAHIEFDDLSDFSEYWADYDTYGMWTDVDLTGEESNYAVCDIIPVRDI